jgi:hypothetical protein
MLIKTRSDIATATGYWPAGSIIEWPDHDAKQMVAAGAAEVASVPLNERTEKAIAEPMVEKR